MPNNISRFRADLIDVAWGLESAYGLNCKLNSQEQAAHVFNTNQTSTVNELWGQFGLVTGGVDLPNPSYEWTPFFGLGVQDRNMMFPVQGRERLEGRLGGVLMCHDASRLIMEQAIGLVFNGANLATANGLASAAATTNATSLAYVQSGGASSINPTYTTTSNALTLTGQTPTGWNSFKPASAAADPIAIVIIASKAATNVNRVKDAWAFIGYDTTQTQMLLFKDRNLTVAGVNGVVPAWATGANVGRFSVHSITREAYNNAVQRTGVTADDSAYNGVIVRPTLTQESFMLAARFRADDGGNFVVNYKGCKVARTVFNFEEGNPVNYGIDFIAKDMRHNMGQDDGSGSLVKTLKYAPIQVTQGADVETISSVITPVVIAPNDMKNIRVTEQPHFYSRVELTVQGVAIARFRRFSITIDNQLDPRYYLTQNSTNTPNEDRQVLHEILEGRRNISFSGSLDMDNDGSAAYPASNSPKDALFLRYLLNQGMTGGDARDMEALKGVGIRIEVRRMSQGAAGGADTVANAHDKWFIYLPSSAATSSSYGTEDEVGLILRSATHNVPAPPNIHVPVDIDGFAASMHMEFLDNVAAGAQSWAYT